MTKAIINANLILEDGIIFDGVLIINDGVIASFGKTGEITVPAGAHILDAHGLYVGPGFVDIHCHGGDGKKFESDPAGAAQHFLSHGETSVLATLYYDLSPEDMNAAVELIQNSIEDGTAPNIAGIYMEGPYMNPKYGACPEKNKWKGKIDLDVARSLAEKLGSTVRVWAVAPEREGIVDFVKLAREVNPTVQIAFGHTEATTAEVFALKKHGLRIQTHSMNATKTLPTLAGTRNGGPDEACLYDPDFYAELISDSLAIHVHPDMQRLLYRIKGDERIILISDSTAFDWDVPEEMKKCPDLNFDANGDLAGSKLSLDYAAKNMMTHTPAGLCSVFKMASTTPARAVGLDDSVGSIEIGKRANLVICSDKIDLAAVLLDGEIVSGSFPA